MLFWLAWSSLCIPGWPQTHRDLPATASQVLELKYVYILFIHVCMRIMYMPGACRRQERALDPLELALQMAVGHSVGAENLTKARIAASALKH